MPRALVTGATGFVGSNLVARLRKLGWDVHCLVRDAKRANRLVESGATIHLGTLAEPANIEAAMNSVDTVFHVAGRVRALSERQFIQDNVEGTRNVISAAADQAHPPTTIMVSSLAAGGPSRPGQPRCESDSDCPISDYGHSKLAAEQAATQFADTVPLSIIRPPIIFGPADHASLAIFRGIKQLRVHPVPGFRQLPVSIVHVTDLCNAMIRLAENGTRVPSNNGQPRDGTGIYYIAAERTISYGEIGKLAAKSLGCHGIALPLPKTLFWIIGGAAELVGQMRRRPGVLTLDKVREAVAPAWECDDSKLRRDLDYQPAETLEQRFAETAEWYQEQGWL